VSRVAVLGEQAEVGGYELAGALVLTAEEPADVRAAWSRLPEDAVVVVVTARAAKALTEELEAPGPPFVAVLPP
jgi:vacuolar-type H+-ATPase subunit F/Vma7